MSSCREYNPKFKTPDLCSMVKDVEDPSILVVCHLVTLLISWMLVVTMGIADGGVPVKGILMKVC